MENFHKINWKINLKFEHIKEETDECTKRIDEWYFAKSSTHVISSLLCILRHNYRSPCIFPIRNEWKLMLTLLVAYMYCLFYIPMSQLQDLKQTTMHLQRSLENRPHPRIWLSQTLVSPISDFLYRAITSSNIYNIFFPTVTQLLK